MHEWTLVDVLSWGVIKEFSENVYLLTKHKNKHSNCQPFDLFTVPVQESSDPPVDQPPQSPSSPKPSGKKIVSRKFNGTCIWYKRTFDLFNVHMFIHLWILFSPSFAKGWYKSVLWLVVAVDFPEDNLNYQWVHQQSPKANEKENV